MVSSANSDREDECSALDLTAANGLIRCNHSSDKVSGWQSLSNINICSRELTNSL